MCIARKVGEAAENASKNMLLLTSNAIKLKQYLHKCICHLTLVKLGYRCKHEQVV